MPKALHLLHGSDGLKKEGAVLKLWSLPQESINCFFGYLSRHSSKQIDNFSIVRKRSP